MSSGYSLFSKEPYRTSAKAVCFKVRKFNSVGYLTDGYCWFPKSQLIRVVDDFYNDTRGQVAYLIPTWLVDAKEKEGYDFY